MIKQGKFKVTNTREEPDGFWRNVFTRHVVEEHIDGFVKTYWFDVKNETYTSTNGQDWESLGIINTDPRDVWSVSIGYTFEDLMNGFMAGQEVEILEPLTEI